jgi:hypothetical protein
MLNGETITLSLKLNTIKGDVDSRGNLAIAQWGWCFFLDFLGKILVGYTRKRAMQAIIPVLGVTTLANLDQFQYPG